MLVVDSTNTITDNIIRKSPKSGVRLVEVSTTCCRSLSDRLRRSRRNNANAWSQYNTWALWSFVEYDGSKPC